jgi:hypothetical protein
VGLKSCGVDLRGVFFTGSGIEETHTGRFEARICTARHEDCSKKVIELLLKELKVTFLWHETVPDLQTFHNLDDDARQEIMDDAQRHGVLLSKSEQGKHLSKHQHLTEKSCFLIAKRSAIPAFCIE